MANEHIEEVGLKFKADGSADYLGTLKQIKNEMALTYAEYVRDTAEMDKNATATEKLTAKKKLLDSQIDSQRQKVAVLTRQVNEMTAAENADQQAIEKKKKELAYAEAKLSSYQKQLADVNDDLKSHSEWTDKASKAASDFGNKLDEAGKKASVGTAAIVAGGTAAAKTAGNLEAAANRYIATTGKSVEETERYKAALDSIYTNGYGEGYDDIAASMQTVNNIMGDLPVDVMQSVVEKAYTLEDAFGIDITESVRGVDALMKQFGISADEAFDLLAKGAQNGLNQNGDLADQVAEYSVYFSDLGYTATEFFDVMYSGAQNGAFQIDYLNDVVKEFGIRTKDNSDATKAAFTALGLDAEQMTAMFAAGGDQATQAMQMVNTALFSMQDSVKQNEIGVALYGTKWEDLGVSAVQALTSTNASLGTTSGTMAQMQETMYSGFNVSFEALGRSITSIASSLGEVLLPFLMQALTWVQGLVTQFSAWFTGLSEGEQKILLIITAVVAAIGPLLNILGKLSTSVSSIIAFVPKITSGIQSIGKIFSSFVSLIAAHPIVAAITAVIAIVAVLWNKCEWFRDLVKNLWEWIKSTFQRLVDWLKQAFEAIASALSALWEDVKSIVQKIVDVFQSWIDYIKSVFLAAWTAAITAVTGVFSSFFESVKSIWENIKEIFSGIINFIRSVFAGDWKGAWESIVSIFGNVFSLLGNLVKAPINAVISIINGAIAGINKLAINIPDWVPLVGGKRLGFSIPEIPLLASGGQLLSGMAIVAEAGPELISQQGGRTVVSPLSSKSSNSGTIDLSDETIDRLAALFARVMKELNFTMQVDERDFARLVREVL